ncbi:MAG: CobW family GTP-binding protein, partial [Gammaproteobacteria bacterium]
MSAYASLIPVNVITGFLGSGKTTLLRHLLQSPAFAHTAVMINELGEVGLDHELVRNVTETTLLLENGCVCCAIRDDLRTALRELYSHRERAEVPRFDRLVIETSGLADPMPIAYTVLTEPVLQHHFRLGNVVTTLDACNGAQQLERFPEATQQIAAADRIVLTKTDRGEATRTAALREQLAQLNAAAPILEPREGEVDAQALLAEDAYGTGEDRTHEAERWLARAADTSNAPGEPAHRHTRGVSSFCVKVGRELDWTAFGVWMTMLLNRHGDRVLRIKGLLNVAGVSGPVLINAAQHIVHPPSHLDRWPTDERSTRIIFIVRDLDCERIRASLETFNELSNPPPCSAPPVESPPQRLPGVLSRTRG